MWIWVPPGSFEMGSPEAESGRFSDEGPVHNVTFDHGYFIQKYEVTVAQHKACETANACTVPSAADYPQLGWGTNTTENGRADHPQNGLKWQQCKDVCAWLAPGGRLPSEAEWEYAATGPFHKTYPWGDSPEPSCENDTVVFDDQVPDGSRPWGCDTCTSDGCSGTKPAGSAPAGAAWCGALDMAGNVWEYCEDIYHDSYFGAPTDGSARTDSGSYHVTRGASFGDGWRLMRSAKRGNPSTPADRQANLGVRCVRPLPGLLEQPANEYTSGNQTAPEVASLTDGRFVVVWNSEGQDGSGSGVFGRIFDSKGLPAGQEFQVNAETGGAQVGPSVAALRDGRFVVVWSSGGIRARMFLEDGSPDGDEFAVHASTLGTEGSAVVSSFDNGAFVVTWAGANDGSGVGIKAQRFNSDGSPAGVEFVANTYIAHSQAQPSSATFSSGEFVIIWESNNWDNQGQGQDGSRTGIFGQRFSPNGDRNGSEFLVNTTTNEHQRSGRVSRLSNQGFIAVWMSGIEGSPDFDGSGYGVFSRQYSPDGTPSGNEFLINSFTTEEQIFPSVANLGETGFAVVWESEGQDGSGFGIFGQVLSGSAEPVGAEFQVNVLASGSQRSASISGFASGEFVVAWQSEDGDTGESDVFVRRFLADGTPMAVGATVGPFCASDETVNGDGTCSIAGPNCLGHVDGVFCDDGDPCTEYDTCANEVCAGSPVSGCEDEIVLKPEAEIIPDEIAATVDNPTCGVMRFPFVGGVAPLDVVPGAVLVSGLDGGFLCKVLAVEEDFGDLVLTTEQASLDDVIENGTLAFSVPIQITDGPAPTPARALPRSAGKPMPPIANDISLSFTLKQVTLWEDGPSKVTLLPGKLVYNPDFDVVVQWEDGVGIYLKAQVLGTTTVELSAEASFALQKSFSRWSEPLYNESFPFYIQGGLLPVTGRVRVMVIPGFDANIAAQLSTSVGIKATRVSTVGAEYRDHEWSNIRSHMPTTVERIGPTLDGSVGAGFKVKLNVWFQLILYESATVNLNVMPYLGGAVTAHPNLSYDYDIDSCFMAGFGGLVRLFWKTLGEWEVTLIDVCDDLWSGGGCFDACGPAGLACHDSSTVTGCGEAEDGDSCLDDLWSSCPTGETCTDGVCGVACTPHASESCSDGYIYWFDSCGNREDVSSPCECGCSGSTCIEPCCVPGSYVDCYLNDIWSFDSCGNPGSVTTPCDCGCVGNACATPCCDTHESSACDDTNIRWYDSCGNAEDVRTWCDCGCSGTACTTPCCSLKAYEQCSGGDVYYYDSCDNRGSVSHYCEYGCTGAICDSGPVCTDNDSDGYDGNCEPIDCDDDDDTVYPGATELWDVKDNDCDGQMDEDGLTRKYRYKKEWTSDDWEHRFTSYPLSGFVKQDRYVEYYPGLTICSHSKYATDECILVDGGKYADVRSGIRLVAFSECIQDEPVSGAHYTLYLTEDYGEFGDYDGLAGWTCYRRGYVLSGTAITEFDSPVAFYRQRSCFCAGGKNDNMWDTRSAVSGSEYSTYDPSPTVPHFYAPGGY